jgi:hypothetical protein
MEEELDLKIAKAELTELKKDALEAMETQIKRSLSLALFFHIMCAHISKGTD